jgi:hypothetical protein
MALNTLIGRKNSNSFITIDEADSILVNLPDDVTDWDALSDTEKEYRLILAAHLMGMLGLRGRKAYKFQKLCFPRTSQEDFGLEVTIIPDEAKRMQAAIAYSVVHRGLANRPSVTTDETYGRVNRFSVGGILHWGTGSAPLTGGTLLDAVIRSTHFNIYLEFKPYLTQISGGVILNADEVDYHTLSSTTTTSSTSTTTSSSSSSSSSTT